jgi:hypothetical protein
LPEKIGCRATQTSATEEARPVPLEGFNAAVAGPDLDGFTP